MEGRSNDLAGGLVIGFCALLESRVQLRIQSCLDGPGRAVTQGGPSPTGMAKLRVAVATLGLVRHSLNVGLGDRLTARDAQDLLHSHCGGLSGIASTASHLHRVDREHTRVVEVQRDDLEHVARAVRPQVEATNRRFGIDVVAVRRVGDRIPDVVINDPVPAGADVDPGTNQPDIVLHT